jgi:hypothetical protein
MEQQGREPEPIQPRFYSAEELRHLFNPPLSLKTVRRLTASRQIPCIRVGRLVFYEPEAVVESVRKYCRVRAVGME